MIKGGNFWLLCIKAFAKGTALGHSCWLWLNAEKEKQAWKMFLPGDAGFEPEAGD